MHRGQGQAAHGNRPAGERGVRGEAEGRGVGLVEAVGDVESICHLARSADMVEVPVGAEQVNQVTAYVVKRNAETLARAGVDVLALDEVLGRLEQEDPTMVRIIELRFFAGMREREIAQALGTSRSTVQREWRIAKRRLALDLDNQAQGR